MAVLNTVSEELQRLNVLSEFLGRCGSWLYFDNDKVPLCSEGARSMYHEVRILVANAVHEVRVASLVDFPMECV